jgi:hypothetical protein
MHYTLEIMQHTGRATSDKILLKPEKDEAFISLKRKRVCEILSEQRLAINFRDFKSLRSSTTVAEIRRIDSIDSFSSFVAAAATENDSQSGGCEKLDDATIDRSNNLSSLPQELLLKITSFIGPRSSTLIKLSLVDKRFNSLMSRVGAAMLVRAKANFQILLPKLNPVESNLCLFMRHTQSHHEIQNKCQVLRKILKKDFVVGCCFGPIIVRSLRDDQSKEQDTISTSTTSSNADAATARAVSIEEINSALDISLELMGQDVISYFLDNCNLTINDVDKDLISSERRNIIQHCSESLEFQVLSLAGQCGAKVYKFLKMQQAIQGCWDMENGSIKATADHADIDRMDRARLLMQFVICRDLELAKKDAQLGFRRKRLAVGRSGIIIQHGLMQSLLARYQR